MLHELHIFGPLPAVALQEALRGFSAERFCDTSGRFDRFRSRPPHGAQSCHSDGVQNRHPDDAQSWRTDGVQSRDPKGVQSWQPNGARSLFPNGEQGFHQDGAQNLHSDGVQNFHQDGAQNLHSNGTQSRHPDGAQNWNPEGVQSFHQDGAQNLHSNGAQNLNPDGVQSRQPDGAQNLHSDGVQNCHPDGAQSWRPDGAQSWRPDDAQSLNPDSVQSLHPDSAQNLHSDGAQNLHSDGAQSLHSDVAQSLYPDGAQSRHPDGSQSWRTDGVQSWRIRGLGGAEDRRRLLGALLVPVREARATALLRVVGSEIRGAAFDLEGTLTELEFVDALAGRLGFGERMQARTRASMTGRTRDFSRDYEQRMAALRGVETAVMEEVIGSMTLADGVEALCRRLHAAAIPVAVISGGCSRLGEAVRTKIALRALYATAWEERDARFTGRPASPIVDPAAKLRALEDFARTIASPLETLAAAGDGANDIEMLAAAGTSLLTHATSLPPWPEILAALL